MDSLELSTYLGPNLDPAASALAASLSGTLDTSVRFDASRTDVERIARIRSGSVQVMWMCGLLTMELMEQGELDAVIVAAPVLAAERSPVYRSVIVVANSSHFRTVRDLADSRLVINQRQSWSGYHALRVHLAAEGLSQPFFASVWESGSHAASVEAVVSGRADCAAVDHTMWEFLRRADARVIGHTEDWPAPPLSLSTSLEVATRDRITSAVLEFTSDRGVTNFVPAEAAAYSPLRLAAVAG